MDSITLTKQLYEASKDLAEIGLLIKDRDVARMAPVLITWLEQSLDYNHLQTHGEKEMKLSAAMKKKISALKKDRFYECDTAANRTIMINIESNVPKYKTISRTGFVRDGCHH